MIEIYKKQDGRLVYCGSGAEPVKFRDENGAFKPEVGQRINYDCWHENKAPFVDPMRYSDIVVEVLWQGHGGVAVIVERITGYNHD